MVTNSDVDVCIVDEFHPLHIFGGSVFQNTTITTCITYSIFFAHCLSVCISLEFASGFVMSCYLPPNGIHLSSEKIFGCPYVEIIDKKCLFGKTVPSANVKGSHSF